MGNERFKEKTDGPMFHETLHNVPDYTPEEEAEEAAELYVSTWDLEPLVQARAKVDFKAGYASAQERARQDREAWAALVKESEWMRNRLLRLVRDGYLANPEYQTHIDAFDAALKACPVIP